MAACVHGGASQAPHACEWLIAWRYFGVEKYKSLIELSAVGGQGRWLIAICRPHQGNRYERLGHMDNRLH